MPIYEYYCSACQGRYKHLARGFDAPAPACPRCGNAAVERLISAARVLRGAVSHAADFEAAAAQVDSDDMAAAARFLQASGRLEDAAGVYGSPAYRELLRRRSAGATDHDMSDLVGDLVAAVECDPAVQATAARKLGALQGLGESVTGSHAETEHGHEHEHGACHHCAEHKHADNLGWA